MEGDDPTRAVFLGKRYRCCGGWRVRLALASVELEGLVAVRRAETGSGADYYIAAPGIPSDDLEDCLRLEVSGVDRGDESTVYLRLRQKIQQTLSGSSSLPAIAAVVGFRSRVVALGRADEE